MKFAWKSDVGTSSITEIEALARSSGVPFSVTSTYRPNDPGYHGKHNAIDMVSSPAEMRRLASYLYQYSPYLLELIHSNGSFFVKDGQRYDHFSADIVSKHYNHVYCAATLSGLRAASEGKLTIPSQPTGTVGCLPTLFTITTLLGGVVWIIH